MTSEIAKMMMKVTNLNANTSRDLKYSIWFPGTFLESLCTKIRSECAVAAPRQGRSHPQLLQHSAKEHAKLPARSDAKRKARNTVQM